MYTFSQETIENAKEVWPFSLPFTLKREFTFPLRFQKFPLWIAFSEWKRFHAFLCVFSCKRNMNLKKSLRFLVKTSLCKRSLRIKEGSKKTEGKDKRRQVVEFVLLTQFTPSFVVVLYICCMIESCAIPNLPQSRFKEFCLLLWITSSASLE